MGSMGLEEREWRDPGRLGREGGRRRGGGAMRRASGGTAGR